MWLCLACWGGSGHILTLEDLGPIPRLVPNPSSCSKPKPRCTCRNHYFIAHLGLPSKPKSLCHLTVPSLCPTHLLPSPAMMSSSWAPVLQMDGCSSSHEEKSPQNYLGIFSEAKKHGWLQAELLIITGWMLKGRLQPQNFFLKNEIIAQLHAWLSTLELFSHKTSCSCFLWEGT